MLNIRNRAVAQTLEFQLTDSADDPLFNEDGTPCMALIHGPGSRIYLQAQSKNQAKLMAKVQKGKDPSFSADERLRNQAEFLASITDRLDVAYDELEGRDKLLAIYGDPELGFIAEQVAKKAGDWANFTRGSAKS